MARRNLSRALGAAALVMLSGGGALLATGLPAAAELPPVIVKVHADRFEGPGGDSRIYARPEQPIVFELVDPADTRHTVTLRDCNTRYRWLCEQRFDNPRDKTVDFRFSAEAEYGFYDRYAPEAGRDMTGTFIITTAPPPIPPSTTTTTRLSPTTTTTTTAPPTTTTTAPGTIRPQMVPDPPPTSTTTMAPPATSPPAGEATPPPGGKGKDKEKDKPKDRDKSKAAAAGTPTTEAPADPNAVPPDSLFDPAFLTPSPVSRADGWGDLGDGEVAALDAATLADLLHPAASTAADGDDSRLTMYAVGALALLLLGSAVWGWQHRSSRYIPA